MLNNNFLIKAKPPTSSSTIKPDVSNASSMKKDNSSPKTPPRKTNKQITKSSKHEPTKYEHTFYNYGYIWVNERIVINKPYDLIDSDIPRDKSDR